MRNAARTGTHLGLGFFRQLIEPIEFAGALEFILHVAEDLGSDAAVMTVGPALCVPGFT